MANAVFEFNTRVRREQSNALFVNCVFQQITQTYASSPALYVWAYANTHESVSLRVGVQSASAYRDMTVSVLQG